MFYSYICVFLKDVTAMCTSRSCIQSTHLCIGTNTTPGLPVHPRILARSRLWTKIRRAQALNLDVGNEKKKSHCPAVPCHVCPILESQFNKYIIIKHYKKLKRRKITLF